MNFGQAIEEIKTGKHVARSGWNGRGMWIALQPTMKNVRLHPYIFLSDVNGFLVPWNPNNLDMLAEDWVVV